MRSDQGYGGPPVSVAALPPKVEGRSNDLLSSHLLTPSEELIREALPASVPFVHLQEGCNVCGESFRGRLTHPTAPFSTHARLPASDRGAPTTDGTSKGTLAR
jgi:hypothetical protein